MIVDINPDGWIGHEDFSKEHNDLLEKYVRDCLKIMSKDISPECISQGDFIHIHTDSLIGNNSKDYMSVTGKVIDKCFYLDKEGTHLMVNLEIDHIKFIEGYYNKYPQ